MLNLPNPLPIDPAWLPHEFDLDSKRIKVKFWQSEKRVMKKKKQIPVSIWAERHRVLPNDAAIPGKWHNINAPHLAGVMDASFFPSVEEIVCCWPPQCGKSDMANNCMGYAADRRPGNFLVVYPDELTAKENSKDRINPMFEDSPRLRTYHTGYEDDKSSLKIRLKHMKIYLGWASSVARMANKPAPYGILDEEDKFVWNKKETAPANLVRKRQRTFSHMRKLWRLSSPSIETGPIWKALTKEAEVIFDYWLKCPLCGAYQLMDFDNITWPDGKGADPKIVESRKEATYICEKCGEEWDDRMPFNVVKCIAKVSLSLFDLLCGK